MRKPSPKSKTPKEMVLFVPLHVLYDYDCLLASLKSDWGLVPKYTVCCCPLRFCSCCLLQFFACVITTFCFSWVVPVIKVSGQKLKRHFGAIFSGQIFGASLKIMMMISESSCTDSKCIVSVHF